MATGRRLGTEITATGLGAPGRRRDSALLGRRARRGERAAFEEIFRSHHQELYRYCLAILRNRHDAEDATQSAMTAALRSLPAEEREIEIRPWLFRVAHNEAVSLLRRRSVRAGEEDELADRAAASQDEEIATRQRLRALVADLDALPERQRSAIVMRELSGLSYGEIATAISCTEGGARQAVYEARTALREREEGRDMECEQVRMAISDRDGRRLRGRRLRAHLDGCDGCRGFAASIAQRQGDLGALFPPLPAAAAAAMLGGIVGGGAAGGGAAAGGAAAAGMAGGGLAASTAVKGASLVAAAALAAGVADVGGLIEIPNPVGGARSKPEPAAERPDPAAGSGGRPDAAAAVSAPRAGSGAGTTGAARVAGRQPPRDRDSGGGRAGPGSGGGSPDRSGSGGGAAPAAQPAGPSAGSPGKSGSMPAQSGSAPGQSGSSPGGGTASAPGQTGSSPGGGTAAAPGQTGTSPGGGTAAAPGQTGGSKGNSASAPGRTGDTGPGH